MAGYAKSAFDSLHTYFVTSHLVALIAFAAPHRRMNHFPEQVPDRWNYAERGNRYTCF